MLLPQIMKDIVQRVPEERVQNSVVEQIGGVLVPQIWEPIVDGLQFVTQERVQNRIWEQFVDGPVPRSRRTV